jgi:hypothetical protein
MNENVSAYLDRFVALRRLDGGGCTEAEIAGLETSMSLRLPAAYKAYLLLAGGATPSVLTGSDCTLHRLHSLQAGARELLRENGQPELPPGAFVFLMHQGYQFFFFVADGKNDDPPVFYYVEGKPGVARRYERFSDLVAVFFADGDETT